jgi:hypothetical protein
MLTPSAIPVSSSSVPSAIEVTVASLANPAAELALIGTAVPQWAVCKTVAAGTDDATWYRLDATSGATNVPYVVASLTAGLKWVAVAGAYANALEVQDGTFAIAGSADRTKTIKFEVDAQTAADDLTINSGAQTDDRTLSVPVLTANATLAVLSETQTFTGLKTFSNVGGLIVSAGITSGSAAMGGGVTFDAPAATAVSFLFKNNSVARWELFQTGTTVDFRLAAYDSGGAVIDTPIGVVNAAGGSMTLSRPIIGTSATASTTTATGALILSGGAGVAGSVNSGGDVVAYKAATTRTLLSQKNSTSSTTIGDKDCRLILQADSGTVGAGGDIVWIATSDTGVERWAAITGGITANSGSGAAGDVSICTKAAATDATLTARLTAMSSGSIILGSAALATTATDGFLYVAACAGAPTGVPTAVTGRVPIVVDSTNNKLYFYSGGAWRDAGP